MALYKLLLRSYSARTELIYLFIDV